MSDESSGMVILAGNSHPALAALICEKNGVRLGDVDVYTKTNRETGIELKHSIRGKDIFIIQSASSTDVNNSIVELLILAYAAKTSSARSITVVVPYLPYSKHCRIVRRSSITLKLIAEMICSAGATRFVSLDLYKKEIQGFFSIPVDNLRASPFLLQYIRENIPDFKNAVMVAKYPGVMHKATSYAERLRLGVAVIHGDAEKSFETPECDGRQSPPKECKTAIAGTLPSYHSTAVSAPDLNTRLRRITTNTFEFLPVLLAKEKPPLHVVGDVNGKVAIVVDDIFDEARSFVAAADILKAGGAKKVYVVATHGLFSGDATSLIQDSCIDEVIVTNTVPHEAQKARCNKIKTVDISTLVSEAIRRIYYNESMSVLFKDVTIDD